MPSGSGGGAPGGRSSSPEQDGGEHERPGGDEKVRQPGHHGGQVPGQGRGAPAPTRGARDAAGQEGEEPSPAPERTGRTSAQSCGQIFSGQVPRRSRRGESGGECSRSTSALTPSSRCSAGQVCTRRRGDPCRGTGGTCERRSCRRGRHRRCGCHPQRNRLLPYGADLDVRGSAFSVAPSLRRPARCEVGHAIGGFQRHHAAHLRPDHRVSDDRRDLDHVLTSNHVAEGAGRVLVRGIEASTPAVLPAAQQRGLRARRHGHREKGRGRMGAGAGVASGEGEGGRRSRSGSRRGERRERRGERSLKENSLRMLC